MHKTITPSISIRVPGDSFVGKQITALVRVDARLAVLELADGSQLQFQAVNGELVVGGHVELAH